MIVRRETQEWLNFLHSETPEVGDYWRESFCPYLTVLGVDQHNVRVMEHIGPTTDKEVTMTREEFTKHLRYQSEGMRHKCLGEVQPARSIWS